MFFKSILTGLLLVTSINASILTVENINKSFDFIKETYNNNKESSKDNGGEVYQQLPSSLFVKKFINKNNCDQILDNKGYFTTCYNYDLKSAIYIHTVIDGYLVDHKIKKRPKFYDDVNIPRKYRTTYSDYTRSGFDRGHSGAADASFDHSLKSQKSTYVMSNIVPQYPKTNRKTYLKVENYERLIAKQLGKVDVITINQFPKNPKRIGKSKLSVPSGFGKIFFNESKKFQKCFYIPNDDVIYDIRKLEVSCNQLVPR